MAQSFKHAALKAKKRREYLDNLPPTKFPQVINPHTFDHSTILGDKTCLKCGQLYDHKLHIKAHYPQVNLSSKLGRCMCGLNFNNPIHLKEA